MKQKVQVWVWHRPAGDELQVLLLRMVPARGGYWQPVTGSVEEGETLPAAALREASEETGLAFSKTGPVPLAYDFEFDSQWGGRVRETVFSLECLSTDVILDPREHVEWQWCSAAEAGPRLAFDSNREGLRRLLAESR